MFTATQPHSVGQAGAGPGRDSHGNADGIDRSERFAGAQAGDRFFPDRTQGNVTDYPLKVALTLREREVDEALDRLAAARHALAAAQDATQRADAILTQHRARREDAETEEGLRDMAGRRAEEMLLGRNYLQRLASEEDDLARARLRFAGAEAEAEAAVERARENLAQARATREAVERHHRAWQKEQRRASDAREEAEQDDRVAAQRSRRQS